MLPHLHFHVSAPNGNTLPISFADVAEDRGVPRMGKVYTSGNHPHDKKKAATRAQGHFCKL
jgi:hypothetical protein